LGLGPDEVGQKGLKLLASFEGLNSSLMPSALAIFLHKDMCKLLVF